MKSQGQVVEGRIEQVPVAEIVRELHGSQATGVLLLLAGEDEKKICFRDGRAVYATSTLKAEKLGYLLVEDGMVGKEAILEASRSGKDLRAYLLEGGRLSEEEFDEATARLVGDIVATAFDWQSGSFSFVERDDLDVPGMVEGVSMPDLFLEGARCIEDRERVRAMLGDLGRKVALSPEGAEARQELHLEPMEELVFAGVDGTVTVAEVLASSPMGDEMTERFLLGLLLAGILSSDGYRPVHLPRAVKRSKVAAGRKKGARVKPRRSVLRTKGASAAKPAAGPKRAAPSAEPAAAPEPPAERTQEQEVEEISSGLEGKDHYEILGLERKATDEEIRRRYHELAKRLHPDRLPKDAAEEFREKVEKAFARLGEAYNVLREAERRKQYDEALLAGKVEERRAVDPRALAAESFTRGLVLYRRGDMAAAAQYFQHATSLAAEREEYWRHLGLALSRHSLTRKRAEEAFLKAIEISPASFQNYYHLGVLYKAGGLRSRAIQMIEKYLMWDPEDPKVLKELAELRGEDEDKDRKGGALGGLFGKKL